MKQKGNFEDVGQLGLISPEAYSTAWVALVPDADNLNQPAWPQALEYLRAHQLEDGGWGEPHVYYAHERLISTLAVLYALGTWDERQDDGRVERGVAALHKYVQDISSEPNEPIGFEILLPSLLDRLAPYHLEIPAEIWSEEIQKATKQKLLLIGKLEVNYNELRTWWFNLEMLTDAQLAQLDERILNEYGAVAGSLAATAAYLRALRLHGRDSVFAAAYLEYVLKLGKSGGVGVCWPIDAFELTWVLDSFMRAGVDPDTSMLAPLIKQLHQYWQAPPVGLSWSQSFPLNDADGSTTGYWVLRQAGLEPSHDVFSAYWGSDHFLTYRDELVPSVSANVHALTALRKNLISPVYKEMAIKVTEWLRQQMDADLQLNDKWHVSPLYVTAHAVTAFMGWDDDMAHRCTSYILDQQDENGGWGSSQYPNLEETSHAVLGLYQAWEGGILKEDWPLKRAAAYFQQHQYLSPTERLWIGKTLYQPIGVTKNTIHAAWTALSKLDLLHPAKPRFSHVSTKPFLKQSQLVHAPAVRILPDELLDKGPILYPLSNTS